MPEAAGEGSSTATPPAEGVVVTTNQTPPPPPPPPPPSDSTDWRAEFEKATKEIEQIRQAARRHEDRAKANGQAARELESLRRQTMTENERAVAEARDTARSEALREVASERVSSRMAVAAAGRLDPKVVAAITAHIAPDAFVLEDGSPDDKAIAEFINGIAPPTPETPPDPRFPDLGQGQRNTAQALNDDGLEGALRRALNVP